MFFLRTMSFALCIVIAQTISANAQERCGTEQSELCQRLEQCINRSLREALAGTVAATDVLNVDYLRQRALGRQGRNLTQDGIDAINSAYQALINNRFAANRDRFTNAYLTVTFVRTRRSTHIVDGLIMRNGNPYRYTTYAYFASQTTCRFYDVVIEGVFTLSRWLLFNDSLEDLYRENNIRQ